MILYVYYEYLFYIINATLSTSSYIKFKLFKKLLLGKLYPK